MGATHFQQATHSFFVHDVAGARRKGGSGRDGIGTPNVTNVHGFAYYDGVRNNYNASHTYRHHEKPKTGRAGGGRS